MLACLEIGPGVITSENLLPTIASDVYEHEKYDISLEVCLKTFQSESAIKRTRAVSAVSTRYRQLLGWCPSIFLIVQAHKLYGKDFNMTNGYKQAVYCFNLEDENLVLSAAGEEKNQQQHLDCGAYIESPATSNLSQQPQWDLSKLIEG